MNRFGTHWREFRLIDLVLVLATIGAELLAANLPWWVVTVSAVWAVFALVSFRLWRAECTARAQAQEEVARAEERLTVRARLDVLHGLLEEGWRLEPLVLHLPTKKGWPAEKLRAVIERVGKPVLDWQSRVRKELEADGDAAVSQWDGALNGLANEQSPMTALLAENGEAADLLSEVVLIRTGYFRRVPLLKNFVASARGERQGE